MCVGGGGEGRVAKGKGTASAKALRYITLVCLGESKEARVEGIKWMRRRWEEVRAGKGEADGAEPCGPREGLELLL